MLFFIAAALVVLWIIAFVVLHVTSALIHLLLFAAIVIGAIKLFSSGSGDAKV
ncbi:MAG: hypothetical protein KGN34_08060 [Sphingomonadales bacterium]|nr:hypothetical protein [Sphingomonadales bacterium]